VPSGRLRRLSGPETRHDERVSPDPDRTPDPAPVATVEPAGPGPRRRIGRPVLTVVSAAALLLALVVFRHRVVEWWDALVGVRWQWVAVTGAVQLVSVQCLVLQQRVLLRAGGGGGPIGAVTSTTYASNGISLGLPVAGAVASAAYTYRRLHDLGNAPALVGWVLAVSGISSTVTLAAVLALGSGVTGSQAGAAGAFLAAAAAVAPVVGMIVAFRNAATRTALTRLLQRVARALSRWVPPLRGASAGQLIEDFLASLGSFRLTGRTVAATGLLSLTNWLLDAACLATAVVAVGAPVPWRGLLLVWAAGAVVSSARLTPGGIGVVEAALASALVAAGLPASQAVPAVVVYRLVSVWLLAAIGGLCLVATPRQLPADR
jgi:putative heme transporter